MNSLRARNRSIVVIGSSQVMHFPEGDKFALGHGTAKTAATHWKEHKLKLTFYKVGLNNMWFIVF